MASTPPAQIRTEVHTPPTPLHGSAYHSSPSRYNTRSRKLDLTPEKSSPKHKSIPSPSSDSEPVRYLSATTVIARGMLPTPVKTPRKTQPKTMTSRALFQDAAQDSPRKKKKRNGFSLESFSETNEDPIEIHIDSRDHVPEPDTSEDNPFYSKKRAAPEPTRASKRQKKERPVDTQVQEAIHKDEGMVYVFRGKKVFRRFDDTGDEEEVIDDDELGLLRDRMDARDVGSLTTLTRKSIKPKRLFQDQLPPPADDHDIDTEVEEVEAEIDSPSRTRRTRTRDLIASSSKVSPFASWRRIKPTSTSRSDDVTPRGRKRTADEAL